MDKYLSVFKISLAQEFAYKANFIMWRVRNILQIFLVFFLWDTIFAEPGREVFGYDRSRILTYVFLILVVRALVLSSRTVDVAGEVARGDLSNYLVKPVNYFKYWFVRDLSSKGLNIGFALVEAILLYIILKPPFFIQTDPLLLVSFVITILLAMLIYFLLLFLASAIPFWMPEAGWGVHFLLTAIFVEFLSGALFPLDILPGVLQSALALTPFPYLIFFPIQTYLGQMPAADILKGMLISGVWVVLLYLLMKRVWAKGLKAYQAYGR